MPAAETANPLSDLRATTRALVPKRSPSTVIRRGDCSHASLCLGGLESHSRHLENFERSFVPLLFSVQSILLEPRSQAHSGPQWCMLPGTSISRRLCLNSMQTLRVLGGVVIYNTPLCALSSLLATSTMVKSKQLVVNAEVQTLPELHMRCDIDQFRRLVASRNTRSRLL